MRITPFMIHALRVINSDPNMTATRLGEELWPDHPGHRATKRCGNRGVTQGTRLNYAASSYRSKLVNAGLVRVTPGFIALNGYPTYHLTTKGHVLLAAHK